MVLKGSIKAPFRIKGLVGSATQRRTLNAELWQEDYEMAKVTTGIKLDLATKERIKNAAELLDRTPHWFMKTSIMYWLNKIEAGSDITEMLNGNSLELDNEASSVSRRLARIHG